MSSTIPYHTYLRHSAVCDPSGHIVCVLAWREYWEVALIPSTLSQQAEAYLNEAISSATNAAKHLVSSSTAELVSASDSIKDMLATAAEETKSGLGPSASETRSDMVVRLSTALDTTTVSSFTDALRSAFKSLKSFHAETGQLKDDACHTMVQFLFG